MSEEAKWAAARARVIYGVNHMARRSVRDVMRATRCELRGEHKPVDPWMDACIAGRSGNHAADFMVRFAHLLEVAGRTPCQVRQKLIEMAHRIADACTQKQHPARLQTPGHGQLTTGKELTCTR